MEIRRLVPEDAVAYRTVRLRSLWEHPHAYTSTATEEEQKPLSWSQKRLAEDSVTRFWGAFDEAILIGIVGLHFEEREKNRHKATVIGLYLKPEYAGQGIGRRMLDASLDYCRQTGIELLVVTVTHGNDDAQKLYRDVGFKSFGVEPGAIKVDGKPFDKEHMYLQLKAS